MKTIAIMNKKGGVGKTTTTLSVAAFLGQNGFSVLAIDMDPQGNLSQASGAATAEAGTFEFLNGAPLENCVQNMPKYALVAADARLSRAEKEFDQFGREHLLEKALDRVKGYDYVFLDTSPSMDVLALNALTAADTVVICCQTDSFSLSGLDYMKNNIDLAQRYYNNNLSLAGILLTRYDTRAMALSPRMKAQFDERAGQLGMHVFSTFIRENVDVKGSQMERVDIFSYKAKCPAAEDYAAFTKELITGLEGGKTKWPKSSPKPSGGGSQRISIPRSPRKRAPRHR